MSDQILEKGRKVVLLSSHCEDNTQCTDRYPCDECLSMCNTFELKENTTSVYTGQLKDWYEGKKEVIE